MGDPAVKPISLTFVYSREKNKHLIFSQDPAYAIPSAVLYRGCSLKCCKSRGTVIAESLLSDLQPAGCLPCSQLSYFCPAELWRRGQDKDRVTAGVGVLLLGVVAQPACRDSFCTRYILICSLCPVLCEPGHSSGESAASPMAARWFYVQKAAAGQWENQLLSHLGSFSCSSGYSAQYSSIPTPCPPYPARQTPEWQREVKSRMALSAKSLLKIPGKLTSFSPVLHLQHFFPP